ncbi:MAG: hypothetical protein IKG11_06485 [Atopobiaceae bacterium]|nr:hypothetical protein [Atopobiaceae bacterium]
MRHFVKPQRRLLVFGLLVALCVVVLAGCGKGKTSTGKKDAGTDPTVASGPVWVLSKQTITLGQAGSESHIVATYELDEHGNTVKMTQQPDEGSEYLVEYQYDNDGFVTSSTEKSGENATTVTFTLEKDANGRVTKSTGDDGSTQTLTYNAEGNLVHQVQETLADIGGTEPARLVSDVTYDDEGFMTGNKSETIGHQTESVRSYERDDAGKVTSATTTTTTIGEGGAAIDLVSSVELDDNGNVVRVVDQTNAESYTYIREFEYTLVENPSLGARIHAHIKNV